MQRICKLIAVIFAFIAGTASGLEKASAQDATNPGGYQFFVTPYLWLASVHATTLTPLAREPQVNSSVSTIDLLSHLDKAPFMGSFEARYGALVFRVIQRIRKRIGICDTGPWLGGWGLWHNKYAWF